MRFEHATFWIRIRGCWRLGFVPVDVFSSVSVLLAGFVTQPTIIGFMEKSGLRRKHTICVEGYEQPR